MSKMLLKSVSALSGRQNDHCLSMVIKENTVRHNRERIMLNKEDSIMTEKKISAMLAIVSL